MNFKKSKQQLVWDTNAIAQAAFRTTLENNLPGSNFDRDLVIHSISVAVSEAISQSVENLIDNVYTDAEFEEDLGLRDKT